MVVVVVVGDRPRRGRVVGDRPRWGRVVGDRWSLLLCVVVVVVVLGSSGLMGRVLMLSATDRLSHSMDPIEVNDTLTSHP